MFDHLIQKNHYYLVTQWMSQNHNIGSFRIGVELIIADSKTSVHVI
jgi:hypothetical protein